MDATDTVDAVSRIPDPNYNNNKLKQKWAKYLPLGKLTGDPKKDLLRIFPDQLTGMWLLPGEYDIDLDPDAVPVQMSARNILEALWEPLKKELDWLVKLEVISAVSVAIVWMHNLV